MAVDKIVRDFCRSGLSIPEMRTLKRLSRIFMNLVEEWFAELSGGRFGKTILNTLDERLESAFQLASLLNHLSKLLNS